MLIYVFSLWSIMELDTYCCLIFYGLTLIHLIGPLNQVVQLKYVMCNIYIYIYIYIYIDVCAFEELLSFLLFGEHSRQTHTHTHFTLDWILGDKGRAHWSLILEPSRTRKAAYWISEEKKWLPMAWTKVTGWIFAIKCMFKC